jgi:hypothetical protein
MIWRMMAVSCSRKSRRGGANTPSWVEEAIDLYLKRQDERKETVRRALATRGSLAPADVADLEDEVRRVREHWR